MLLAVEIQSSVKWCDNPWNMQRRMVLVESVSNSDIRLCACSGGAPEKSARSRDLHSLKVEIQQASLFRMSSYLLQTRHRKMEIGHRPNESRKIDFSIH